MINTVGNFTVGKVYRHKVSKGKTLYILREIYRRAKMDYGPTDDYSLYFQYFNKFGTGLKDYSFLNNGSQFELAEEETQESVELLYGTQDTI